MNPTSIALALEEFDGHAWRPSSGLAVPLRFGETRYFRHVPLPQPQEPLVPKEKPPELFTLGPQSDGSLVLQIPDEYHLMILRLAIERHEKNATAAGGTLSAIVEGKDPYLERAQRATTRLKNIIIKARSPENQIADTPVGKAIAGTTEPAPEVEPGLEPIDGRPTETWPLNVPTPRPKLGARVVHPSGAAVEIEKIYGYDPGVDGFEVDVATLGRRFVLVHWNKTAGEIEWRDAAIARGSDPSVFYATERVSPTSPEWGKFDRGKPATDAAAAAPAGEPATDAPKGKGKRAGKAHPGSASHVDGNEPSKPRGQRERNQKAAGLAARAPRPKSSPKKRR